MRTGFGFAVAAPANAPSEINRTTAGCGRPISSGAVCLAGRLSCAGFGVVAADAGGGAYPHGVELTVFHQRIDKLV